MAGDERSREELRAIEEQYEEESKKTRKGYVDEKEVIKRKMSERKGKMSTKKAPSYKHAPRGEKERTGKRRASQTSKGREGRKTARSNTARNKTVQPQNPRGMQEEADDNSVQSLVQKIRSGEMPTQTTNRDIETPSGTKTKLSTTGGITTGVGTSDAELNVNAKMNLNQPDILQKVELGANETRTGAQPVINPNSVEEPKITSQMPDMPKGVELEANTSSLASKQTTPDMSGMQMDLGHMLADPSTTPKEKQAAQKQTSTATKVAAVEAARQYVQEKHNTRVTAQKAVDNLDVAAGTAGNLAKAANEKTKGYMGKIAGNAAAAAKSSKFVGKMAAKGMGFIAKLGCIGSIVWTIIIILMIIGALSFFMNMPAMVIDNMKDWMIDTWDVVKGYVVGKDKPTEKEVKQLAENLYKLNVDLEYWGFASDFTVDTKTGRIDNVTSKYLPVYLAADQRNYMVANSGETISLSSLWDAFTNFFSKDVSVGTGLLHINEEAATLLKIEGNKEAFLASFPNKVKVDRVTKEMTISRVGQNGYEFGEGIEAYRFKLKYWLEKYATPVDFFMALHTATGAPEFVYQMAENPAQGDGLYSGNSMIDINIAALLPNVDFKIEIVYLDIDPKTNKVKIGSDGLPVTLTVAEVKQKLAAGETVVGLSNNPAKDDLLKRAEAFDASNITAYTPYITKVMNHWYYKEVVYQGTTSTGKNVNVYQVEDLPADYTGRVRYQMYDSIQVPGYSGSSGSSTPEGTEGDSSGGSSGGVTSGNENYSGEVSTGDDRAELAASTQLAQDSGISSGGFFGSILDLLNSVNAWVGSIGGITGMIMDLPSQILNSSYASLGNLINGVMPSNLLNQISNGWLKGLGYYANGLLVNTTNIGALNFGQIANTLGINDLRYTLSASNIMNTLGLDKVTGALMDISRLTDINQIPGLVANALDVPELTGAFSGISGMLQNGVTADSLVNTMYAGLSTQMKDEFSANVLSYAKQAFNAVNSGDAPAIAAGLISGLATDLTARTTNEFFNGLQAEISEQLRPQFTVQVEQLLINENSKQLTGLNIEQLEGISKVQGIDFKDIEEVNEDITQIQEDVVESTEASRELSNIVNEISEDYAGIDAVTFYYIAKTIREIFTELDNAEKQIDAFEAVFNNYSVDERTTLQLTTNISRAREAIESSRTSIEALEVKDTRSYGTKLTTAGTEIARIIDTNKEKMNAATAAVLMAQGNATSDILTTSGNMVQKIDVNTITKFKQSHADITLEGFLDTADKLAAIDPTLNGLVEEIAKLDNELKDVTEENVEELQNKVNQYKSTINNIDWLTNSERNKLNSQVDDLQTRLNNLRNRMGYSNLALINMISANTIGVTTSQINTFANQILNLPNATVTQLLNTARQIPVNLVNDVSRALTESIATAVVDETRAQLAAKVEEGLTETLNGQGQLTNAIQTRTSSAKGEQASEEQPLEESRDEILTGFYIKETRYRDYMQKSEPILVPYGFEHWKKLLVTNKYILTGDYGPAYNSLMQELSEKEKETLLENPTYINRYGTSIWNGVGGNLEEAIYAELQSMDSVDSQYLLRYFKELFATYGDELRAAANDEKTKEDEANKKYNIGWIFRTNQVTEIINTTTGETRLVYKSEYEPVAWSESNSGTMNSIVNDPVYGFKEGIEIVAPTDAVIVSKTEGKKNELGEKVVPTITLQVKSSDNVINGMRIIIRGGDFSSATVGSTVTKNQVIGKTTTDNIMILVLNKGSHAQVDDVSRYVYPPYVTVNN